MRQSAAPVPARGAEDLVAMAAAVKAASRVLGLAPTEVKNRALGRMAAALRARRPDLLPVREARRPWAGVRTVTVPRETPADIRAGRDRSAKK